MPPAPKRHCSVIIFDLNTENKEKYKSALEKLIMLKWLIPTKDTITVIYLNTNETSNKYGYDYINASCGICSFNDPNKFTNFMEKTKVESGGDWLEALMLAIDTLGFYKDNGVLSKHITLITDFSNTKANVDRYLEPVAKMINKEEIYLKIMGPDLSPNRMINSKEDIKEWMNDIPMGDPKVQEPVLRLTKLIKNIVVCDLNHGIHLFQSFKNSHIRQPNKTPLKLGLEALKMACTLRKIGEQHCSSVTLHPMEKDKFRYFDKDLPNVEYQFMDLVSCVERHNRVVPITNRDRFKVMGDRCMDIVGFTPQFNIPDSLPRGDTCYSLTSSSNAMHALIEAANQLNMYGILKRVYNKNNNPKYFVIVPNVVEDEERSFTMQALPYAEDIRCNYQEMPIENYKQKFECEDEIIEFLDSLDPTHEAFMVKPSLMPSMMFSHFSSKITGIKLTQMTKVQFDLEELEVPPLQNTIPSLATPKAFLNFVAELE